MPPPKLYPPAMIIVTDERCTDYHREGHPERPSRIADTLRLLRKQTGVPLQWSEPDPVSDEQILRAHRPAMLDWIRSSREDFDGDTPWHPEIAEHALRSVGGAVAAQRLSLAGNPALSLFRPPGHHATDTQPMGFCYLNSMAIAALEASTSGGKRAVAVFDFDVHHGNGTEDILLGRPGMGFFSVHQSPCYPGTGLGDRGTNCFNHTVRPGVPRKEYVRTLQSALDQLREWKPDLVGVSAGFDAYARDPLAQGTLEAEDYHWLGTQFRSLGVPIFSVLEGGYSSDLPELVLAYVKGLEAGTEDRARR